MKSSRVGRAESANPVAGGMHGAIARSALGCVELRTQIRYGIVRNVGFEAPGENCA